MFIVTNVTSIVVAMVIIKNYKKSLIDKYIFLRPIKELMILSITCCLGALIWYIWLDMETMLQ